MAVNLRGFSKESTELVREMEDVGWVFRRSNHGVVGRAPNDKTTISVSRSLNGYNRSLKKAFGDYARWLRSAHPETQELAADIATDRARIDEVPEEDAVTAAILRRRLETRVRDRIEDTHEQLIQAHHHEGDPAVPTITQTRLWHAKGNSRDNIPRATERTWSTGRIDYVCAFDGCSFTSRNPRSVTQHYGAVHTRDWQDTHAPASTAVEAVEAVAAGAPVVPSNGTSASAEPVAPVAPVEMIAPEDSSTVPTVAETVNPDAAAMIQAIQGIVSRPLLEQIERLSREVTFLGGENDRLLKERDEALSNLAKIQSDLDALRSLVSGIGR